MKPTTPKMKADVVNIIPIHLILEDVIGAIYIQDQQKWEIENGDNIQVREKSWYNWSRQQGGKDNVSLIKHWIELGADAQYTLDALKPIYRQYENIMIKEDLDATLPNNNVQVPKVKI